MTTVDIDNNLHEEVKNFVENNKTEYPSAKFFIGKAVKILLRRENRKRTANEEKEA